MARNISGHNPLKSTVSLNFVSVYITQAERGYRNYFPNHTAGKPSDRIAFVGFFHTTRGTGKLELIHKTLYLHENEIAFIHYKDLVSISSVDGEWDFYALWFYLYNFSLEYDEVFPFPPLKTTRETIETIIRYLNYNDYNYLCRANGLGQAYLTEILISLQKKKAEQTPYQQAMRDIVFYINEHLSEPIFIRDLAKRCNLCEKHFRNIFHEQIGIPPKQYIINAKLEKALFMLGHTSWSVAEISDSLAFFSPAYFISCFKKKYLKTPAQYRTEYIKQTNKTE